MLQIKGVCSSADIMLDEVDESVISQIYTLVNSSAFENEKIRIMPDCHAGKGSVVGFTSTFTDKVIPNVIGVDIGCGIYSWNLGRIKLDLKEIDNYIRENIPHGFAIREKQVSLYNTELKRKLIDVSNKIEIDAERVFKSIGSLGGGNHFIEIGIDPDDNIWLSIHSGSRNFGLQVANFYQKKAKEYCSANNLKVQTHLEYLKTSEGGNEYLDAMLVAQEFANANRIAMYREILKGINIELLHTFENIYSVHNYIDLKTNIIRKGAISAQDGERMVIPFNMRDGIAVCTGLGNSEWNNSAPHGAGRIYSRAKAKKEISLSDFKESMTGIYSTCISNGTLDESPMAYKDKDLILEAIKPTAKVNFLIKPIYNFKAN